MILVNQFSFKQNYDEQQLRVSRKSKVSAYFGETNCEERWSLCSSFAISGWKSGDAKQENPGIKKAEMCQKKILER